MAKPWGDPVNPKHNLFLDTNVYLSFYRYSPDNIEELKKLSTMVENKVVNIIVTEQVEDEFWRNREKVIEETLIEFEKIKSDNVPNILRWYEAGNELLADIKEYNAKKKKVIAAIRTDAGAVLTKADDIITRIFKAASPVKCSQAVLNAARIRTFKGNPPGKAGSNGDAINWECLLEMTNTGEDLHFVCKDGDFKSFTDDEKFSPFLQKEWEKRKGTELHFYPNLSPYFRKFYPHIKLADELHRHILLSDLKNSGTFKEARAAIRALRGIFPFSPDEAKNIAKAATTNSQIYMIAKDSDIQEAINHYLNGHEDSLPSDLYIEWRKQFNRPRIENNGYQDSWLEELFEKFLAKQIKAGLSHGEINALFDSAAEERIRQEAIEDSEASTMRAIEAYEEDKRARDEDEEQSERTYSVPTPKPIAPVDTPPQPD